MWRTPRGAMSKDLLSQSVKKQFAKSKKISEMGEDQKFLISTFA